MSRPIDKGYALDYLWKDPVLGILIAASTALPADTTPGYAKGCIYIVISGAAGSELYVNEGSLASSAFKAVASVASGTFTTLTATTANITTGNLTTAAITTLTSNPAGGTVAVTDRMTVTDGVASGTARVVGGRAFTNVVASTAVASTSAETAFDQSYTIPANTLKANSLIRVKYWGLQTTEVGTDTLRIRAYIGGTGGTMVADSVAVAGANNAIFEGEVTAICRTAGATGTFVAAGDAMQPVAAGGTQVWKALNVNSTTINTQANQAVVVSATFNTSNANSVRLDGLEVEIY